MNTFCRRSTQPSATWALLLLCLFLQACSQMTFLIQDKPGKVATLIEQHRFYPALDLIDSTSRDDPDYPRLIELRGEVLSAITRYEKERLKTTNRLIAEDKLREALLVIEEALSRVPASKDLLSKRKQAQAAIERNMARTNLELAQLRAESLPGEIQLLEKMARYTDEQSIRQSLQARRLEADNARQLLIAEAKSQIDSGNMDKARKNASLAQAIQSGKDSQQLLHRIDSSIQTGKLKRLKQAIDDKDFLAAKRIASGLTGKNQEEQALLKSLNQKVELEILQLTREGQHAYTKGDLDGAIERWELALRLDPDNNEIKTLLQRARTFKTNYQRFKRN